MRRRLFAMSRMESMQLLREARTVHVAFQPKHGPLVLRALHAVVYEGFLVFHGSTVGEKTEMVGADVVVSVEETIAELPSSFFDAERACPATTWYRSVQLKGRVEAEGDLGHKAAILQTFMDKYQPQGGYVPIDADNPLYRKPLEQLWVAKVSLENLVGRSKLGQHKKSETLTHVMEQLWSRGDLADPAAIEWIRKANPDASPPDILSPGEDVTWHCHFLSPRDAWEAGRLVEDCYWNASFHAEEIGRAFAHSSAFVGARCIHSGELVAVARAVSDSAKHAWIYDVCVREGSQRIGMGKRLLHILLEHPAVRATPKIHLSTKDAQGFYQQFGFQDILELPPRPWHPTRMIRQRSSM
ncbi:MAG: GNAT family N-acetyltransferase [Deltaproteobacteria bacterium]|nr:MAG: GNAT family N-acetyltransferase [Deltaproteobacteria bacterium]